MPRAFQHRCGPSDAAAISELLARSDLATLDQERERLKSVMAQLRPRRSTIVEDRLKALTRQRVELMAAIARAQP